MLYQPDRSYTFTLYLLCCGAAEAVLDAGSALATSGLHDGPCLMAVLPAAVLLGADGKLVVSLAQGVEANLAFDVSVSKEVRILAP